MRIELLVEYCLFQHVPKEQSLIYLNLCVVLGKEIADKYTYERGMDHADRIPIRA